MATLYDIKGEFLALYELALQEDDEQAFLDTLESLKGELEVKAEGYAHVIKQLEMEEAECDRVQKAFQGKREQRTKSIKRMKEAIISALDVAGMEEISAGDYKFKIAKNGGVQPLKIDGEVPDNFTKIEVKPDNELIRKALNEGQDLEFAHLEPRGRHLNIK